MPYHWSFSIPSENIRKPSLFSCFWEVKKETGGMKWINKSFLRSSYWRCSIKTVLWFSGRHLCQSPLFNKIADVRPATLLNETLTQVFSCELSEIFKNIYFEEHLRTIASIFWNWTIPQKIFKDFHQLSLREKCPNKELFLVSIFLFSV